MAIAGIGNGYNMYGNPYDGGGMAGVAPGNAGLAAGKSAVGNASARNAAENAAVDRSDKTGAADSAVGLRENAAAQGMSRAADGAGRMAGNHMETGGLLPGTFGLAAGTFAGPKIVLSATGMPLPQGSEAVGEASREESADPDSHKKIGRKSSPEECQTCKERKYQDGSDENVSFKAAAHISPEAAGAAVRAHEGEHVSNAYKEAAQKGGEVVNASVMIHTAICPECGRTYVSGGTTNTTIRYSKEENPYEKAKKAQEEMKMRGKNIDYAA